MATESTQKKMNLNLFVDKVSQKVLFAEVGNDFVDFIIHLMHLPLCSVTKILKDGMVGCFETLYKSIESLDNKYYEKIISKDVALKPRTTTIAPLLSLLDSPPANISFYRCCSYLNYVSDSQLTRCPMCSHQMSSLTHLTYVSQFQLQAYEGEGELTYIVTDNLEIKPMSISVIRSLTKDFDSLDEKDVEFGQHEGLALLKASLEKDDVLSTVFFNMIQHPKRRKTVKAEKDV